MSVFSVHEAKNHLSKILALLDSGEEIIISRCGMPVARILPFEQPAAVRTPDALKNQIEFDNSFFDEFPAEELAVWNQKT